VRGAIAAAVVALVVLVGWQRPDPFSDHLTVRAIVADAAGLRKGSEVRVAGSAAGEVADVRRERGRTELELHVDRDAGPLRRDATIAVWPRLAFEGNSYVELWAGSADAPALGDRPIPLRRSTSYVPMDRVLRLADAPTRRAIQRTAAGLAEASGRATTDPVGRVIERAPALLGRTARVARALSAPAGDHRGSARAAADPANGGTTNGSAAGGNATRGSAARRTGGPAALRGAIAGLARTGTAVAARERDLVPLLRDAAATAEAVRGERAADGGDRTALRDAIAALPATLAAVRRGSADADRTLARVDALSGDLRDGLPAIAPTVARARTTVRALSRTAPAATPWLRDLRGALDRGGDAAAPTRELLAALSPTVTRLDRSLLPALQRPTPTLGLPSYVAFLNMFAGGGGASRAFQRPGQSSQGHGHFMRFGMRFLTGLGTPAPPCSAVEAMSPEVAALLSSLELCTP